MSRRKFNYRERRAALAELLPTTQKALKAARPDLWGMPGDAAGSQRLLRDLRKVGAVRMLDGTWVRDHRRPPNPPDVKRERLNFLRSLLPATVSELVPQNPQWRLNSGRTAPRLFLDLREIGARNAGEPGSWELPEAPSSPLASPSEAPSKPPRSPLEAPSEPLDSPFEGVKMGVLAEKRGDRDA